VIKQPGTNANLEVRILVPQGGRISGNPSLRQRDDMLVYRGTLTETLGRHVSVDGVHE
jgi:hypothetical protein